MKKKERPMRLTYHSPFLDTPSAEMTGEEDRRLRILAPEATANLISSEIAGRDGWHAPVIDLDHDRLEEVRVIVEQAVGPSAEIDFVPSTTTGHHHAYVNVAVRWEVFEDLLLRLEAAGLVEENYVGVSIARRAAFVRKPGERKPEMAPSL